MRIPLIFCALAFARASDPAHDAAAKAIALIQTSQKNWTQSCNSCHQQLLPPLAFRTAREHGIPVDEKLARAADARAFALLSDLDRAVQYTYIIDPAISDGYMLLAADAAGVRPGLTTAIYARHLAVRQKADGHWVTLDVRPPQSYSNITATAIAVRALQIYGHHSLNADTHARVDRARHWLASVSASSAEERAMQLLGLSWTGEGPALIGQLSQVILAAQRPDGGWSSREDLPSDAYSTGETLVALAEADPSRIAEPAWRRGIQFLITTQARDGSWRIASRLRPPAPVSPAYFETGYPYGHDQFISAMGAAWAVRALALSVPKSAANPLPELTEAAPRAVEPWVESAVFGSASILRNLLDKGLSPDAVTKSGGTTLLMLAQPDLEKTKLLIERGAKIDLRARTKFSALMVAALYPSASPTLQFLLDHRAQISLPKDSGAPLFNASPIALAALAGNAGFISKLRQAGDDIEAKMLLTGIVYGTPLEFAVFFGDLETAAAVLDNGARVDAPDPDGITALGWASIGNQVEIAKLLIAHGASVNHVDRFGMTPLLYAASIDFGDDSLIALLLKSGANPAARSKAGLTALELARKYGHAQSSRRLATGPN